MFFLIVSFYVLDDKREAERAIVGEEIHNDEAAENESTPIVRNIVTENSSAVEEVIY